MRTSTTCHGDTGTTGIRGPGQDNGPLPYLFMYTTTAVAQPDGFRGETWYDNPVAKGQTANVSLQEGNIRLQLTGDAATAEPSVAKWVGIAAQETDDMTIEFEYEKDPGAKLYVNVQSYNNWRDLLSISHGTDGTLQAGSNRISAPNRCKVTIHLHRQSLTADVYVNDALVSKGYSYKYGAGYENAGKIGFTLQNGSAAGSGVTMHYVRYMETAQYANIALAKDKTNCDAADLMAQPAGERRVLDEDLTMPEWVTLPYGSTPVLGKL